MGLHLGKKDTDTKSLLICLGIGGASAGKNVAGHAGGRTGRIAIGGTAAKGKMRRRERVEGMGRKEKRTGVPMVVNCWVVFIGKQVVVSNECNSCSPVD